MGQEIRDWFAFCVYKSRFSMLDVDVTEPPRGKRCSAKHGRSSGSIRTGMWTVLRARVHERGLIIVIRLETRRARVDRAGEWRVYLIG